jgi:co-chaperonin GroES (HSP10)
MIKSSQFNPLFSQMLIRYDRDTESEGGIKYAKPETTWYGTVIRVGPDCTVGCGDRIFMSKYRGENLTMEDGEFTLVDQKDALAVIDD